ncbi:MAG TPA: LacI family DNA-binding transcriptional regulator [Aggregatilinea sp.]|uniref:LacI family DNA-binding transcriptional regulator n=1 Tax=Aggregatilinea sp. TaxID=2806333 RepID=UPI002C38FE73|nr:LacI family DNA-binding transcriptional regulator [Aggregatilinea sp.]HML24312.1 LacI family DNA-binding transcriptional regulator [Aggregatilinea sp.]
MSKKVTLKDVARRAGVSYQTVSKVLSGQKRVTPEVRDRIYAAVEELDYRPNVAARNLRTQSSYLLGYSWQPDRHYYFNPVLEEFQQSVVEAAEELGYHILLFPQRQGQDLVEIYQELVLTGRVDGFILSGLEYYDPRVPALNRLNVPLVAFGRTDSDHAFPYVDVDGQAGIYLAARHLMDLGHERIAILCWPETSRVGTERLSGYLQAMEEAGLPIDPAWIVRGETEYDFGYGATPQLLDLPLDRRPTAIVTMHDLIALGTISAVQERGLRVGHDIAVTGFDNVPVVRYFRPGLTTLQQPVWDVGQRVVQMLISLLKNEDVETQQVLLTPKLVIRESTQPYSPEDTE